MHLDIEHHLEDHWIMQWVAQATFLTDDTKTAPPMIHPLRSEVPPFWTQIVSSISRKIGAQNNGTGRDTPPLRSTSAECMHMYYYQLTRRSARTRSNGSGFRVGESLNHLWRTLHRRCHKTLRPPNSVESFPGEKATVQLVPLAGNHGKLNSIWSFRRLIYCWVSVICCVVMQKLSVDISYFLCIFAWSSYCLEHGMSKFVSKFASNSVESFECFSSN